jgi:hypothetical protein
MTDHWTGDDLLAELDQRLTDDPDFAAELEFVLAGHRLYLDHEPERAKRMWVMRNAHLSPGEKNWLFIRGGDEFGNRTVAVRASPKRYVVLATTVPLRRVLLDMEDEMALDELLNQPRGSWKKLLGQKP